AVAVGRVVRAAAAGAAVPARAVGRDAPAGDDRDRAGVRSAVAAGRRADDRAGRHRAGADPGPARRDATAHRHGDDAGDARLAGRAQPLGPRRRHVRGHDRGGGADGCPLRPAADALHRGAHERGPAGGRAEPRPAPGDPRPPAGPARPAGGMQVQPALPVRPGPVPHRGTAPARGRLARAPVPLLVPGRQPGLGGRQGPQRRARCERCRYARDRGNGDVMTQQRRAVAIADPPRRGRGPRAVALLALALSAVLIAACGANPAPLNGGSGEAAIRAVNPYGDDPTAAGEPKRGGVLVLGMDREIVGFDPTVHNTNHAALAVYDTLLKLSPEGKPELYLAESMQSPDGGLTWRLRLRAGVRFSDGTPLDADAVIVNVQRHIDEVSSPGHRFTEPIASMTAVDPLTVEFRL